MPRLRRFVPVILLSACAACSSSSGATSPQAKPATVSPSVSACPSPAQAGARFPAGAASRVPHPAFAQSPRYSRSTGTGQRVLRFSTAMPIRDAAAFVQEEYPAAGYRIVGGDAETHEADIVWAHGGRSGKTRLSGITDCSTTWTVAVLPTGVSARD